MHIQEQLTHLRSPIIHLLAENSPPRQSSRENFHNTISARADDQPAIAAPANIANTFTSHGPVGDDVLRANSLLQRPETYACVVPGGNGFAAVLGEAEGGYGGGVGEHGVGALAWEVFQ